MSDTAGSYKSQCSKLLRDLGVVEDCDAVLCEKSVLSGELLGRLFQFLFPASESSKQLSATDKLLAIRERVELGAEDSETSEFYDDIWNVLLPPTNAADASSRPPEFRYLAWMHLSSALQRIFDYYVASVSSEPHADSTSVPIATVDSSDVDASVDSEQTEDDCSEVEASDSQCHAAETAELSTAIVMTSVIGSDNDNCQQLETSTIGSKCHSQSHCSSQLSQSKDSGTDSVVVVDTGIVVGANAQSNDASSHSQKSPKRLAAATQKSQIKTQLDSCTTMTPTAVAEVVSHRTPATVSTTKSIAGRLGTVLLSQKKRILALTQTPPMQTASKKQLSSERRTGSCLPMAIPMEVDGDSSGVGVGGVEFSKGRLSRRFLHSQTPGPSRIRARFRGRMGIRQSAFLRRDGSLTAAVGAGIGQLSVEGTDNGNAVLSGICESECQSGGIGRMEDMQLGESHSRLRLSQKQFKAASAELNREKHLNAELKESLAELTQMNRELRDEKQRRQSASEKREARIEKLLQENEEMRVTKEKTENMYKEFELEKGKQMSSLLSIIDEREADAKRLKEELETLRKKHRECLNGPSMKKVRLLLKQTVAERVSVQSIVQEYTHQFSNCMAAIRSLLPLADFSKLPKSEVSRLREMCALFGSGNQNVFASANGSSTLLLRGGGEETTNDILMVDRSQTGFSLDSEQITSGTAAVCGQSQLAALSTAETTESSEELKQLQIEYNQLSQRMEQLNAMYLKEKQKRKELLEEVIDLKGNIRVFCRVRPPLLRRRAAATGRGAADLRPATSVHQRIAVNCSDAERVSLRMVTGTSATTGETQVERREFEFDEVLDMDCTQQRVFEDVSPLMRSCMNGYNVCIFAYGQTGSGKTFTMEGSQKNPGVIYRALDELFCIRDEMAAEHKIMDSITTTSVASTLKQKAAVGFEDAHIETELTVTLSCLEVYNEVIRDLLIRQRSAGPRSDSPSPRKLKVHLDRMGRVTVPGLTQVQVKNTEDVRYFLKKVVSENRSVGSTNMNERSSRSHCVVFVDVCVRRTRMFSSPEPGSDCLDSSSASVCPQPVSCTQSRMVLIDLAGSERVKRSGVEGKAMAEAQAINKSLAALGNVMSALQRKQKHVPFRDSTLTYLLHDCLGGDSKALMFCNISCETADVCESANTLQFASRVRAVELGEAKRNAVASRHSANGDETLKKKLTALKMDVESKNATIGKLQSKMKKYSKDASRSKAEVEKKMRGEMNKLSSAKNTLEKKLRLSSATLSKTKKELEDLKTRTARERVNSRPVTASSFGGRRLGTWGRPPQSHSSTTSGVPKAAVRRSTRLEQKRLRQQQTAGGNDSDDSLNTSTVSTSSRGRYTSRTLKKPTTTTSTMAKTKRRKRGAAKQSATTKDYQRPQSRTSRKGRSGAKQKPSQSGAAVSGVKKPRMSLLAPTQSSMARRRPKGTRKRKNSRDDGEENEENMDPMGGGMGDGRGKLKRRRLNSVCPPPLNPLSVQTALANASLSTVPEDADLDDCGAEPNDSLMFEASAGVADASRPKARKGSILPMTVSSVMESLSQK